MPSQFVSRVLAFTPSISTAALLGVCCVTLVADGVNSPTFTGFKEDGSSMLYDNRRGIRNKLVMWFDGVDYYYAFTQAINATPVPVPAASLAITGPASGLSGVASSAFTVATDGVTTATTAVTLTDGGAGGTFNPATLNLAAGTNSSATFTYTPSAIGVKTLTAAASGLTSGTAAYTVGAALRMADLVTFAESGSGPYTYTDTSNASQFTASTTTPGPGGTFNKKLLANTDGQLAMTLIQPIGVNGKEFMIGVDGSATTPNWKQMTAALYTGYDGTGYKSIASGNVGAANGAQLIPAAGDIVRVRRSAALLVFEVARTATPTTFIAVHTVSAFSTALQYIHALGIGLASVTAGEYSGVA